MVLGVVTVFMCKHCVLLGNASKLAKLCIRFGCKFAVRIPLCVWWLRRNKYSQRLALLFFFISNKEFTVVPFAWTLAMPVYCHAFASGSCSADFDELLHRGLLKGVVTLCCSVGISFMSCLTNDVNYQTVFARY